MSIKSSIYEKTACRYIWLNKYDCNIAFVSYTSNLLNGWIDPTFLHICAEIQASSIHTSHLIAKYLQKRNMPAKLNIYGTYNKYLIDLCKRFICIYVPNMKSMQSTMWQWELYTYLKYITEQILFPHCIYMLHCTTASHLYTYNSLSLWYKQLQSNGNKCKKINLTKPLILFIFMNKWLLYIQNSNLFKILTSFHSQTWPLHQVCMGNFLYPQYCENIILNNIIFICLYMNITPTNIQRNDVIALMLLCILIGS